MAISSVLGSSALLPAGLGFRNKIINGDFNINQRDSNSTTSGGTFVFDRWMQWAADGTSTFSSQSFTAGNAISGQEPIKYAQVITSGQTLASAQSNIQQRVEDVRTCAGQQVVVSFWAKAGSGTPKIAVEIEQNFGSGGSSVVNYYGGFATISTTWARYSVALTVPSVAGKTIGLSSFMALNLWVSSGATNGFRNGSMGIQNNTFQFWGVQLEQNLQPTPFEQRPIGTELQLCQRYFSNNQAATLVYNTTTSVGGIISGFQAMRGAPSIYNIILGAGAVVIPFVAYYNVTALNSTGGTTAGSIYVELGTNSGIAGRTASLFANILQLSAEL